MPEHILAIDVGTGTQDILLFIAGEEIENCPHLIMPSPTALVAQRARMATASGHDLLLTGVTMGGGPGAWAVEHHLQAGFDVFATAAAARTFDDDLLMVERMGIQLVSDDEAAVLQRQARPRPLTTLTMTDLDLATIQATLHAYGLTTPISALAVAVFDHGNAPPGYSDRRFRFDYLTDILATAVPLTSFAHQGVSIPERLTRMQAVADVAPSDIPLVVMDTGAAAVIGSLDDPVVRRAENALIVNVGNFHTLAFALRWQEPIGVFEHHTGLLTGGRLDDLLDALATGTIDNATVFAENGHGAFTRGSLDKQPFCALTGPRRRMMAHSRLQPYRAVPHGDMMLAGCYGLLRGVSALLPNFAETIAASLADTP